MRQRLFAGLAAAALLLLLVATNPLKQVGSVKLGSAAPAFQLASMSGGLTSLSDFSGRVVLLSFWATWCDTCKEEMPLLQELHSKLKDRGFTMVAVSVDEDGRKAVAPFVARTGLSYPVLLADARVKAAYHVYGLPTAFLLDRDGTVVNRYVGRVSPSTLENDILRLLERRKT